MKREFDIFHYRKIEESYNEKLKYINHCINQAENESVKNAINELKFIRLQIREYCAGDVVLYPQMIPTGRKQITVIDALILNYVNERIIYYTELQKIDPNIINKPGKKEFPALPDCFIERGYFDNLLKNPRIAVLYTPLENGSYQWNGTKTLLGGLALRLFNTGKINADIVKTNQDLARIFCPFFNVSFNKKEEKSFQPDRAKFDDFYFIK